MLHEETPTKVGALVDGLILGQQLKRGEQMEQVEIIDRNHISMINHWSGLLDAAEHAEKKAKQSGIVGMVISAELIHARAEEYGAAVKMKNVILAMQNGFDPKREKLVMLARDGMFFLTGEPFDLLEQADNQ